MTTPAVKPRILVYLLRRDVRLSDNPVFHSISLLTNKSNSESRKSSSAGIRDREDSVVPKNDTPCFTHLLPVYIFPAQQVEVSGFLSSPTEKSPYPPARSRVANLWRTGPHRARFIAEGAWDLKQRLEGLGCGSGLEVRVGMVEEVVEHILSYYAEQKDEEGNTKADVEAVWITSDEDPEAQQEEAAVKAIAHEKGVDFRAWNDEKYYVDDGDLPFNNINDLPNVYTTFRKSLEPLRKRPRQTLPTPDRLPPLPPNIPPQKAPFEIPTCVLKLKDALLSPLEADPSCGLPSPPRMPEGTETGHPFEGGESSALVRLSDLITNGLMTSYKATRNGMLGVDYSTKLSAYLAQGHLTARQIHWAMVDFEEGNGAGKGQAGYGKGESDGTAGVRFELLWRDYMRLCLRKFGDRFFHIDGIRDWANDPINNKNDIGNERHRPSRKCWRQIDKGCAIGDPAQTLDSFTRFRSGRTGVGLIDAANRELFLTGYTSNRARQNVASFLSSHLGIDWRLGAEWYEFLLIDYDVSSNWGNWQYVSGVGNDPRQGRIFNPVKQAFDYDPHGKYIKAWVPELRGVRTTKHNGAKQGEMDQQRLLGLFQAWKLSLWEKQALGLDGLDWVEHPLVQIQFSVNRGRGGESDGKMRGGGGVGWRGRGRGRGRGRDMRRLGNEEKAERLQSQDSGVNGF
ncbi:cryptochrome DASH [Lophiotrema nucula]|uniref:Cryptochrome DASH n=1 Tax=Lophiotrema nucula TaxID=690887 RepID=A0A6A5ZBT3_9PLEO|nr:cryptochrome DASH [Lophiotrema nucula]